jgi:Flp pilus assembly protein TadB
MTSPTGRRSPRGSYFRTRLGIRLALIAALVVGGIIFHHHGHGYAVVRGLYLAAVVGLLIWRISYRQRRQNTRRNREPGPFV